MKQYLQLLEHVLTNGREKSDRTGTGSLSVFGYQMRFNIRQSFPLLTTKKLHIPAIVHELLWHIRGGTNIAYLRERSVHIWDAWADEKGDLGPIYGRQWRSWPDPSGNNIDQLEKVIGEIKNHPESRRLLVSAWNVAKLDAMALPPCHCLFQFYVCEEQLSCQLYQRSADVFLGLPFNIASYSLLTCMIAHLCQLHPSEFVWTGGDVHLYRNHIEQAKEQLKRDPKPLPQLRFHRQMNSIDDFAFEDIEFTGYNCHQHIPAPISV